MVLKLPPPPLESAIVMNDNEEAASMDQPHQVQTPHDSVNRTQIRQRQNHLMLSAPLHHCHLHRLSHRRYHKRNSSQSILTSTSSTSSCSSSSSRSSSSSSSTSTFIPPTWIEQKISQLICAKYVPSIRHPNRCGCGRFLEEHEIKVIREARMNSTVSHAAELERWQVRSHTRSIPTTAFGTVEFQGGPHPTKARYVRLRYDTPPETIVQLLLREWRLRVPSLVISVLGGLANSHLQAKLASVIKRGLLRAAKTTGAWVITNGLDTGVTRHVGEALGEEVHVRGSKIVALGIAPWGVVQQRNMLTGIDRTCQYHAQGTLAGRQDTALNPHHNYFLLADNGTSGMFSSAEICLRRRLEQYLAEQPIGLRRFGGHKSRVPIVGVLIEGGHHIFRRVFELLTGRNPVPVVICDGSGRAADLLAFMCRYAESDGDLVPNLRRQMVANIAQTFQLKQPEAETLYLDMKLCMRYRDLLSVFHMGDGKSDEIDLTILTALLQAPGQNMTPADQLSLTMAWQRPDIARTRILVNVNGWSKSALENAMTEALINDRLEFVQLLLEKGLDIYKFLTDRRLEDLYLVSHTSKKSFFGRLLGKLLGIRTAISLRAIGSLLEQVIGNGYQHPYCSKHFDPHLRTVVLLTKKPRRNRQSWSTYAGSKHSIGGRNDSEAESLSAWTPAEWSPGGAPCGIIKDDPTGEGDRYIICFRYPYMELLQWVLLTCRFSLARFMVLSGEEAIAKRKNSPNHQEHELHEIASFQIRDTFKEISIFISSDSGALLSVRILRGMRKFMDVESEAELIKKIRTQEEAFEKLAVELQEHCYRHDSVQTRRLLTYELRNFSRNTCLSLAYMCESKSFIAHPCAQAILSDLWYGGLRESRFISAKVTLILIGLALPPLYPLIAVCFTSSSSKFLEFKTREELSAQPQTWEEHLDEVETSSSSSSSHSSRSLSPSRNSEDIKAKVIDNFPLTTPLSHRWSVLDSVKRKNKIFRQPMKDAAVEHTMGNGDLISPENVSYLCPLASGRVRAFSDCLNRTTTQSECLEKSSITKTAIFREEYTNKAEYVMKQSKSLPIFPVINTEDKLTYFSASVENHNSEDTLENSDMVEIVRPLHEDDPSNSDPHHQKHRRREALGDSSILFSNHQRVFEVKTVQEDKEGKKRHSKRTTRSGHVQPEAAYRDLKDKSVISEQDSDHLHAGQSSLPRAVPLRVNSAGASMTPSALPRSVRPNTSHGCFSHSGGTITAGSIPFGCIYGIDSNIPPETLPSSESHKHQLSWRKKVYEFFSAPVTRFYFHLMLYLVFLLMFICYSLITVPYQSLNGLESYIYLHIITFAVDKFRQVNLSPGVSYCQKMRVFLSSFWNVYDIILSFFSVMGVVIRLMGLRHRLVFLWGRNILLCCCLFWLMRFMELMQIWHFSGPFIYLIVKMLGAMIPLLSLLFIPLLAFGTLREGIMVMNRTELTLEAFKNILLEPHFMLYGEVYAPEIDPKDWGVNLSETPLFQMVPIMNVVYLLYSVVLMLSVVIAVFNSIYGRELAQSELNYKYLQYSVIIGYESRPILPPPFIVFSWIYVAGRSLYRRYRHRYRYFFCRRFSRKCRKFYRKLSIRIRNICSRYQPRSSSSTSGRSSSSSSRAHYSSGRGNSFAIGHIFAPGAALPHRSQHSDGLKLFLETKEIEKLHDFEEECVQDYCRAKKNNENKQSKLQLENINSAMAAMQYQLSEIHQQQQKFHGQIRILGEEVQMSQEEVLSLICEYRSRVAMLVPEILENGVPTGHESIPQPLKDNGTLNSNRISDVFSPTNRATEERR